MTARGSAKAAAVAALERTRLLLPAHRVYERVEAARTPAPPPVPDGLPLPPPLLRMRVAGTPDAAWFLESGRVTAEMIAAAARRHGAPLEDAGAVLDFGCGCGRVIRHWAGLEGVDVHGSDYGRGLVRWCSANLGFATFARNDLEPPLGYPDGRFDVVYAFSVFTHLPEELGLRWRDELARVLAPGGLLIVTTHGDPYREQLEPEELERYDAGELVTRGERVAGSNLCIVFHPDAYLRGPFARGLDLLEHASGDPLPGPYTQDLVVLRKPDGR